MYSIFQIRTNERTRFKVLGLVVAFNKQLDHYKEAEICSTYEIQIQKDPWC